MMQQHHFMYCVLDTNMYSSLTSEVILKFILGRTISQISLQRGPLKASLEYFENECVLCCLCSHAISRRGVHRGGNLKDAAPEKQRHRIMLHPAASNVTLMEA